MSPILGVGDPEDILSSAFTLSRRSLSCFVFVAVALLAASVALHSQDDPPASDPASDSLAAPDPLASADSSLASSDSLLLSSSPSASPNSRPNSRDVSWKLLPRNFLQDQKAIWTFPLRVADGQHWVPTFTVTAATGALLFADPSDDPFFGRTAAFHKFDHIFASKTTGRETIAAPLLIYAAGFTRHDSYMEKTALFAAEAVADSEVIRSVINSLTTRFRPADINASGNYADTFFHSRSFIGSSFPSGHTIAAVTVATVIARRYRNHRWVPWAAYGLASTIGFSRITLRAHFPSDVFLGGALGYAIARYDVLQNQ